ncbi:hypothetical protein UF64_15610 [Thalassospira sp. HJ]|nr:hypothetical protein UF64_15610 [Thalassospira sp. HJ]
MAMRRHFSSALADGNSRKDSNRATKQIVANTQVLANLYLEKRAIHTPTVFGIFLFFATETRQFSRVAKALLGPFDPLGETIRRNTQIDQREMPALSNIAGCV